MTCVTVLLLNLICGTPYAVDGDTLRFGNQSVRLWGVDAAELHEPGGANARQVLQNLAGRKTVWCRVRTMDGYGRHVARCYVGSVEINREVVARGAALDCRRYSGGTYASVEPVGVRLKLSQKPYCKA
jgi:endonuclease YncB( thermonuclease family)